MLISIFSVEQMGKSVHPIKEGEHTVIRPLMLFAKDSGLFQSLSPSRAVQFRCAIALRQSSL